MCGRYSLFHLPEFIAEYQLALPGLMKPRYNIAPSQPVPAIVANDGGLEVRELRWGLIPFWSKDASNRLINARAETVDEKPSFKQSFAARRCLVPADGFYEWKKEGPRKQPYRITLTDRTVFCFAGLWGSWRSPGGEGINSFTIITTAANEVIRPIHNRMPVVLTRYDESVWLDRDADHQTLKNMLQPYDSDLMQSYPITTRVNSPANDSPEILEPLQSR